MGPTMHPLNQTEIDLLRYLQQEDPSLRRADIAKAIGKKPLWVSQMLTRLEKRGLIVRRYGWQKALTSVEVTVPIAACPESG